MFPQQTENTACKVMCVYEKVMCVCMYEKVACED